MTALRFRPRKALRAVTVFALFLAISAIASAQRFGGSGYSAQQVTQKQTSAPPPQTGQAGTAQGTAPSGQNQQNQFFQSWEWWKDEAIKKEMQLRPEQVRSVSNLYDRRVREMKPIDEEYQRQRDVLNKMSAERVVEVSVYSIQVNRVEALRTELFKTRAVMLYQIHKMLTPEQVKKLDEIRDRRRAGRGGGSR